MKVGETVYYIRHNEVKQGTLMYNKQGTAIIRTTKNGIARVKISSTADRLCDEINKSRRIK